jgi:hypothetical protein
MGKKDSRKRRQNEEGKDHAETQRALRFAEKREEET